MLDIPGKAQWSKLKSDAGIEKSAWWKPADAAVGPAISKVEAAKASWKSKKNYDNALACFGALSRLDDAFIKFLAKKDLSAAGKLKTDIEGWIASVAQKQDKLAKLIPALKTANEVQLQKALDSFIL